LFKGGAHTLGHVAVQPLEDHQQFVHDEGLLLGTRNIVLQEVKAEGTREVGGVKINNILIALRRDGGEYVQDVGAVRVNEATALAIPNILNDH